MNRLILAVLCIFVVSGNAFGDEIDDIRAEYTQYGLKVPDRAMFGTSHPSIYFSNSEMGNPNDDYEYFLANHVFWDFMDNLRNQTGEIIVISSGYRSPSYNRSLVDEHGRRIAHDNSLHQYGAGTDATKFGPNYWVNMTESQKDELFVQIGVAATVMQGTYGDRFYIEAKEKSDHLHFELMDYCHFDDNWL